MNDETLWNRVKGYWIAASILAIIVLVAGLLGAFSFLAHKGEVVNQSVVAPPAAEVKHEAKKSLPVKRVQAYASEAKIKLNLPPTVIADQTEQVISTARVADSGRPHTVTTTINTETGESTSFVRADPYPWIAFESRGEVAVSAGYKYRLGALQPIARLSFKQDFLQLKALHVGVVATLDTDRDAYVGVGVAYRW